MPNTVWHVVVVALEGAVDASMVGAPRFCLSSPESRQLCPISDAFILLWLCKQCPRCASGVPHTLVAGWV